MPARSGLLIAMIAALLGWGRPAAAQEPCRPVAYAGKSFTVCTADLRHDTIKLFWKGEDGQALGSFERLAQTPDGPRIAFAMNGGMYRQDQSPAGLYVENGREWVRANTANGPGNFHMKPNGVFFVAQDGAGVEETRSFLKRRQKPEFATQSGPMLVIGGRIHPKISDNGTSFKMRNGVGVRDKQTVLFAISDEPVTFGEFAHLFRDELGCANALFLDGSISALYAPSLGRTGSVWPMGPIIAVLPRS